jgi:signal transduction histidine kinase
VRVCFVSVDAGLLRPVSECRGVTVVQCQEGEPIPDAHLYIWDFECCLDLPSKLLDRPAAQHLVLAGPQYVNALRSCLQDSTCILLKPVSAVTLRAFVELGVKLCEARSQAHELQSLRSDRSSLVQYVLDVNLKLQEYDRERTNLMARAVHDFRTPLTALHGYCGLLAEGLVGTMDASQRELIERMRYSANRLARLASDVLELLVRGQFQRPAKLSRGDIGKSIKQALSDVYPLVQDKELEVDLNLEEAEDGFYFDPEQIERVLVNLLENSCRFAPRHGQIGIKGYPVHSSRSTNEEGQPENGPEDEWNAYRVDVMDSGPGLSPHLASELFEQHTGFSKLSDRSGAGLGLAICKMIVTAHQGAIWATPSEDGGRFSFVLPLEPGTTAVQTPVIDFASSRQTDRNY